MERNKAPVAQRIIGLSLAIIGFVLLVAILNPKGLVGPPVSDRITWVMIAYAIGAMIAIGGCVAAGYDLKKSLEVLVISVLWLLLVLPILYLPLSEDMYALAAGFSPFLALLLWIAYTKVKARFKKLPERKTTTERTLN